MKLENKENYTEIFYKKRKITAMDVFGVFNETLRFVLVENF